MKPETPEEHNIITAFRAMDDVQALIFMSGINAVKAGQITADQFYSWAMSLFERHNAGEVLVVDDLQLPDYDPKWVAQ